MPDSVPAPTRPATPKLLDQVRTILRTRRYSLRTEEVYLGWIGASFSSTVNVPSLKMGAPEVAAFLSYLAEERTFAAATQNQALNALIFIYDAVLEPQTRHD